MIMKPILVVLVMAMTASCYSVDILKQRGDPPKPVLPDDPANGILNNIDHKKLPIYPWVLKDWIHDSSGIFDGKAKGNKFHHLAGGMLDRLYVPLGYNWLIWKGSFAIVDGCLTSPADTVKDKAFVQTDYTYKDQQWRVAIFPSPCHLRVLFPSSYCYDSCREPYYALGNRKPEVLPCAFGRDKLDPNILSCTLFPISEQNVTDVIKKSDNIRLGETDTFGFLRYASRVLQVYFAPLGYNYLITLTPVTWDKKLCIDDVAHKGPLLTTPNFVSTKYNYMAVDFWITIFPNPCEVYARDPASMNVVLGDRTNVPIIPGMPACTKIWYPDKDTWIISCKDSNPYE